MKESNDSRFRRRNSISSSKHDRRRRRQRRAKPTTKEKKEEESEIIVVKKSTSNALDIVRSIRATLPPTEDVLELARQREKKRPKTPPNEWKKTSNLFNNPAEAELGDFYVTKRDFWNARHFYERAKKLLCDVFGDDRNTQVLPDVLEKLGQVCWSDWCWIT